MSSADGKQPGFEAPPQNAPLTMFEIVPVFARSLIRAGGVVLAFAVALMLAFSLTEGFGISLIAPVLQVSGMNLGASGKAARYSAAITYLLARVGLSAVTLPFMLAVLIALIGVRSFLGVLSGVTSYQAQRRFEDGIRLRLYAAIARSNWLFLSRMRSADFVHALTSEIERIGMTAYYAMQVAGDAVMTAIYVAIAFAFSPAITLAVVGAGAALTFGLRRRGAALHRAGEAIAAENRTLYGATVEHMQSLKTAKAYNAQDRNLAFFTDLVRNAARASIDANRHMLRAGFWFELGSLLILGVAICGGIRLFAVGATEILILLVVFARLMPRLMQVHNEWQGFVSMVPSFENLLALEARCASAAEPRGESGAVLLRNKLELREVSFSYQAGHAPALRAISLSVPAGSILALVGPSGSGKSTLADLAMGLLAPDSGKIVIDGVVLAPDSVSGWRRAIGYVGQDAPLFHATIRENLLWARPDATEPEMIEALRSAAADGFVSALPRGLDTVVGDRGATLSHGERQRLALARALLHRPTLLVLDEATNALDSENEARVLAAIERLRGIVTILMIAHRMSTIRHADMVCMVEGGQIVESGTWRELSTKPSRVRAFAEMQRLEP